MKCPCQPSLEFENCCGRYLEQGNKAPTAETLMRSRYSAFVVGNIDYLLETHDPRTRDELDVKQTESWSKTADWKQLRVLEVQDGEKNDLEGEVEFIASFEMDGEEEHHHERAQFFKKSGVWYYRDGKMMNTETFVREEPKVGRNDPCVCGSGKKYKKCCAL